METIIYLATDRGLTVIAGRNGNWRGKVCLEDKRVQCEEHDRSLMEIADDGLEHGLR
jgi:hypothetical protein